MKKKLDSPKLIPSEETVGIPKSHNHDKDTFNNDRTKIHKVASISFEYAQRRKISFFSHTATYFSLSVCYCSCMVSVESSCDSHLNHPRKRSFPVLSIRLDSNLDNERIINSTLHYNGLSIPKRIIAHYHGL